MLYGRKFRRAIFRHQFGMIKMAMKKKAHTFIIFLVIFLFNVACVYSSFNVMVEADFLSSSKYETRDADQVYAEKQTNPDALLVSPALFIPLPGIIFEFLPSFFSPNTLFAQTFSVLRC
jgi:hypothetical protein